MKTLYQASNSVEAHMILHLLEQQGLTGRIDGEYLQGGVGELPAGQVRVMVAEHDYPAAKLLIDKWDAAQPALAPAPRTETHGGRFRFLVFGLALGLLLAYGYYRTPVTHDGIDHNRDGNLDEKWTYAPGGRLMLQEIDRNLDGRIDYVARYGRDNTIEATEADDNFDGAFESVTRYLSGNPHVTESDTNADGFRDLRTNYANGVVVSVDYLYPATGLPEKIEYFALGKVTYSETDIDRDGKMDKRTTYNALGEVVKIVDIR